MTKNREIEIFVGVGDLKKKAKLAFIYFQTVLYGQIKWVQTFLFKAIKVSKVSKKFQKFTKLKTQN